MMLQKWYREFSCTRPPVPSNDHILLYLTLIQYLNQKIDIGMIQTPDSYFTNFTFIQLCVCVVLCSFTMCAESGNHHQNSDTHLFRQHKYGSRATSL